MTPGPRKRDHWIVRMNYRNRGVSFALAFAAIGVHLHDTGAGGVAWGLLALHFLVYPHLVYAHSRRAADPKRTELRSVLLDGGLFGIWVAALGFPVWITVLLLVSAAISHTSFHGVRGLPRALAAMAAGVALGVAAAGWHLAPHTGPLATGLCIACLAAYLLVVAEGAYARAVDLHRTREQLRQGEQALQAANRELHRRLDDIHQLEARLRDQADRDPLTGLYNRRYFDAAMAHELARCRREGLPLSLLLIDIDHFKQVNDTHGHQAGDAVLHQLAHLLREHARTADVICRYGGEEFLLLLPGTPQAAAAARAEACREAFARVRVAFDGTQLSATLSIGVATAEAQATASAAQVLRHADQALYRAKAAGRNRVAAHRPQMAAA